MMFLVSEVHPFDDGNGRLARVMMNTELIGGAQSRIIIPTVFRDDYLDGLRQLTRRGDASVLVKALRYGHDYTAPIDFTTPTAPPSSSARPTPSTNQEAANDSAYRQPRSGRQGRSSVT